MYKNGFCKVALGLAGFMCRPEIPRALREWAPKVDVMILGDGKFPRFDWPTDYSTDGWLEYCEKTYDNVITYKFAGEQIDKRNKYLEIAGQEKCDFLIVWDSDEYIMPDWSDFDLFWHMLKRLSETHPEQLLYRMWLWLPPLSDWDRAHNVVSENAWVNYKRVIKNPGEMKYVINHYSLIHKDMQEHEWIESDILLDGVRFSIDSRLRSEAFLKSRMKWAQEQLIEEHHRLMHYFSQHQDIVERLASLPVIGNPQK